MSGNETNDSGDKKSIKQRAEELGDMLKNGTPNSEIENPEDTVVGLSRNRFLTPGGLVPPPGLGPDLGPPPGLGPDLGPPPGLELLSGEEVIEKLTLELEKLKTIANLPAEKAMLLQKMAELEKLKAEQEIQKSKQNATQERRDRADAQTEEGLEASATATASLSPTTPAPADNPDTANNATAQLETTAVKDAKLEALEEDLKAAEIYYESHVKASLFPDSEPTWTASGDGQAEETKQDFKSLIDEEAKKNFGLAQAKANYEEKLNAKKQYEAELAKQQTTSEESSTPIPTVLNAEKAEPTGTADTSSPGAETDEGVKAGVKQSGQEDIAGPHRGLFETFVRLMHSRFFSVVKHYTVDRPVIVLGSAVIKAPALLAVAAYSTMAQLFTSGERAERWGQYADECTIEARKCITSLPVNLKRLVTGELLAGPAGDSILRWANIDPKTGQIINPAINDSLTPPQYDVQKMFQANFNLQKLDTSIKEKAAPEDVVKNYFDTVEAKKKYSSGMKIRPELVQRAAQVIADSDILSKEYNALPERITEFKKAVKENNIQAPSYRAFLAGEKTFKEYLAQQGPATAPTPDASTGPTPATATLSQLPANKL